MSPLDSLPESDSIGFWFRLGLYVRSLLLIWGQRLCHTDSLSKRLMFINQIVFKISDRIARPWNISHCDLHSFWGQRCHTDSVSKSLMFIHSIVFKLQGKITVMWNEGHCNRPLFWGQSCTLLTHYPKFDVHPSYSLQDIRQNHLHSFSGQCLGHTDSLSKSLIFSHPIVFKI